MALDYNRAIRNLIALALLILLPICLLLMQCCSNSTLDGRVISGHIWRLYKGSRDNDTWRMRGPGRNRSADGAPVADPDDADYAELDYKILHHMDIDESESQAYYRRKAILESRRSTTTAPPRNLSDPVSCALLFKADDQEIRRVKLKLDASERIPTDQDVVEWTKDCASYVKNSGYVTSVLSDVEADFPLAFGIRLHDRAAQAEQLLRTIYRPNNVYCVHVDAKSPPLVRAAMQGLARCLPNVFIATRLERYVYASFSAVSADLRCMKDVLDTGADWRYFLNLAGTEFPLKTNREIVEILKALNGSNDIEQYPFPTHYYHRFAWRHAVSGDRLLNTAEEKEPFRPDVTIQKGCSYNSFSRPFVEWLLGDRLAQRFINWTRDMDSPDELVWATLNHMPQAPGGYDVMVTQTAKTFLSREVIWESSAAYCHGARRVRGICILSVGDLPWLANRWELFANKFDIYFDHYALDCLEEALRNRTRRPDPDRDVNWYGVYLAPHVRTEPSPERKRIIDNYGYIPQS